MVKVPPLISSRVSVPARARRPRSALWRAISATEQLIRAADDRRDEPVFGRHRNRDVRVREGEDFLAGELRVERRVLHQRERTGAHQQVIERNARAARGAERRGRPP